MPHAHLISLICIICAFFAPACQNNENKFELTKAADTWRYESPQGVIDDESVTQSVDLSLTSNYVVWRSNLNVTVDISLKNKTKSFVYARVMPHLFVYDKQTKYPLFWSNIDLSFAESVGPGTMSILSLPVGAEQTTTVPLKSVKFADLNTNAWPEYAIYDIVPTGTYLMRLEMDFYDADNQRLGTMLSNFIEFTTIFTSPEIVSQH